MTSKTTNKEWNKNIKKVISISKKTQKDIIFKCSHTADGKKIKKDLVVYLLENPYEPWRIIEVEDKVSLKQKIATVGWQGRENVKTHPSKLYKDQLDAVEASYANITEAEKEVNL